jgi:hypothetical protein
MNELSGMVLGGGLVFLASAFSSSSNGASGSSDSANQESAIQLFNNAHIDFANNNKKGDRVVLAPSYHSYVGLQVALSKIGIRTSTNPNQEFAIVDLSPLLKNDVSFANERKIQAALVEEGILLCPGEAYGASQPGEFKVMIPTLSSTEISRVVAGVAKVAQKFNSELFKRSASSMNGNSQQVNTKGNEKETDVETESVATEEGSRSTKKKRTAKSD